MNVIESRTVRTTNMRRLEISRDTLLQLLAPHTDCGDIPLHATVFVQVPGGGDWSNCDLDIDTKTPIIITWTEVTEHVNI